MTDFAAAALTAPTSGKHNMASAAFDALRTNRLQGKAPQGEQLTFSDVLDTLNPLQHIPVVAQIYRHLTGDTISPVARVAGDTLYGGPIGLVTSVADSAISAVSGKDVGEHVFASLFGEDKPSTAVASAAATPEAAAAANAALTTGSIAASAPAATQTVAQNQPAKAGQTKPVPQLSPEAFNALMGSFSNPGAAKAANPSLAAASTSAAPSASAAQFTKTAASQIAATKAANSLPGNQAIALATAGGAGTPSKDLIGAMQTALDQYDAMKTANPAMPAASLNMMGETPGY
jgi:hypothetical protein